MTGKGFDYFASAVEDDEAASAGEDCALAACGQTAYDHETAAQGYERCCQSDSSGTGHFGGIDLGEETEGSIGCDLHDGGTCSLEVITVIEVADEESSCDEASPRYGNAGHTVGVDVTVGGHGSAYGVDGIEVANE
jgi:hypothetical protein